MLRRLHCLYLILTIASLLCAAEGRAQERRVQYGLTLPVAMKLNLMAGSGSRRSPFATAGLLATLRISGYEEQAFSWQQHLGLVFDRVSYKVQSGDLMHAELYQALLAAEALLPTRREGLYTTVGIGICYTFYTDAVLHSGSRSAGSFYADVDSFGAVVEQNSRSLLPFVSAGLVYRFNGRCQAGIKLRQQLRNSFEPDAAVTYYIGTHPERLSLSYQPTYLEVSLTGFLKRSASR